MRFNRFYINIFLRIILIILSCFVFVFFVERDDNLLTAALILFLAFIQIVLLIKYVNRTNRDLAEFLIHLQQGDTSAAFSKENITKTFKGLSGSFDKINTDFRKIKSEKIQKEHYLKYVIDNIKIGLLAFNETGEIEFVNHQAKIFLNKKNYKLLNISSLDKDFIKVIYETSLSESTIIKKTIHDELYYLAFSLSEFKIENKKVKLCTIHDVKKEIETNEIESWQKLTSVLTHEMMNSITPITSLAHAIKRYLKPDHELLSQAEVSDELISDIVENADIIQNRGKGLLEFIDNYRTITKLPKPKFETFEINKLLQNTIQLFNNEIKKKFFSLSLNVQPDNLEVLADKGMIEQVIINLIKNSIEASSDIKKPEITVYSFVNENKKIKIQIIDNGKGISKDIIDDIFIPFYTTKENGSGVGLPLSRQIMHLHNGTIYVKSEPNVETVFTLIF